MSVKQKAINNSNLDTNTLAKLDSVLDSAARMMEDYLGTELYEAYLAMEDDANDDPTSDEYETYAELEDRTKRKLEEAEGYFALACLTIAEKKQIDDFVLSQSHEFGEGGYTPSTMDELIKLKDEYLKRAHDILDKYIDSTEEMTGNKNIRFYAI